MTTIAPAPNRRAAAEAGLLERLEGQPRSQAFGAQMRATSKEKDGKKFEVLTGYASVVGVNYSMWDFFGEYQENIAPTAFDKTLAASPDVAYLLNHTGMTMARTTNGTLTLSVDSTGLLTEAEVNPQRSDVNDLVIAVRDENVTEMSFAFVIRAGQWSPDYMEYTITEVDLDRGDVSAVNYGANPHTSISARAKQALDAIDHLEGAPLRAAAERAQARLAEAVEPAVVEPVVAETVRATMNAETAKRVLALQEGN